MVRRALMRRLADALIAVLTWSAAIAGLLWFYDWLGRWYIVVGVLLAIVAGAMVGDRAKARASAGAAAAVLASLPAPRAPAPEAIEVAADARPASVIT
jgi:hypothetical protein